MQARTLIAAFAAGLLVPMAAGATTRIAMLPIVVHTADTQPGYLSSGLIEMLSSRLERSGEIRVVRIGAAVEGHLPAGKIAAQEKLVSFYHLLRPLLDGLKEDLEKRFS